MAEARKGAGRPQGAPAQPGLGGRRPPYTARSAVALRAFFPRHRQDEGQRGRKRDGCKKVGPAAVPRYRAGLAFPY